MHYDHIQNVEVCDRTAWPIGIERMISDAIVNIELAVPVMACLLRLHQSLGRGTGFTGVRTEESGFSVAVLREKLSPTANIAVTGARSQFVSVYCICLTRRYRPGDL